MDPERIGAAMAAHDAVVEVHDLHIWEITSGTPALSAHVILAVGRDYYQAARADLARLLAEDYGITHSTLQVEHSTSVDANVSGAGGGSDSQCDDVHGRAHRSADS
jgi:cobalt-zinc-cadmium efflux system protein